MLDNILFDVTYIYFDFDPHNHNRYEGCMSVIGRDNAKQYAARIAEAANVGSVYVTDAFTGEVIIQFDGYGNVVFEVE